MLNLSSQEALALRLAALLLHAPPGRPAAGPSGPRDVAGVVGWFGAMQAQDLASGLWSLGARLPAMTLADIQEALERREALRTWPMRGTMHLVPPRDARWMLALMGERALQGAAARRAYLGLDEATAERAVEVLGAALAGGGRLTRAQCLAQLQEAGISSAGQVGYHLLWYASQRGVTCVAPNIGKEQSFALLDEWAPDPLRPERDEALGMIALRYFQSHGPTTRQDFAGWTGLTADDARRGIAVAGASLATVRVEGKEMHLGAELLEAHRGAGGGAVSTSTSISTTAAVTEPSDDYLALPGFDEYLLGYKDRTLMLDEAHKQAIIPGGNGVFQATLLRGGRVIGTWKRRAGRGKTVVDLFPLIPLAAAERSRVEAAMQPYGRYLQSPLELRWP